MKKNNKGFMLVETLIMSMVVIGVLVVMYIMFQNVSNSYDKSFHYNTVTGLYITNELRDYLNDNNLENLENNVTNSSSRYIKISCSTDDTLREICSNGNIKTILLADEKLSGLKGKRVNDTNISETMYDFINYLKVDKEENKYRIIVEFNDETYATLKLEGLITPIMVDLLNNSLIPVVYDETANSGAGSWVIADTSTQWYDYTNQKWANAVILNSGVSTTPGTLIDVETQAKAMYVWIPRYEYKIEGTYGTHTDGTAGTQALPGEIEVKFISSSQTTADSGYILHPAFSWDGTTISGMWVGKFSVSGSTSAPTILPNKQILAWQNLATEFASAQVFGTYLSNSTNTDAHMMKNSEWGAVAYLSQSVYGKYGNDNYTGANKEVYVNDTSGLSGTSFGVPDYESGLNSCSYDDTENRANGAGSCGGGASTTGNIYGVYDMNNTYVGIDVMGYLTTANSNYATNPNSYFGWAASSNYSGFASKPADKYFDAYTSTTITTACNGGICYGHALSETSGWYNNDEVFLSSDYSPWILRGWNAMTMQGSGVYSFVGNGSGEMSFMSVLISTP